MNTDISEQIGRIGAALKEAEKALLEIRSMKSVEGSVLIWETEGPGRPRKIKAGRVMELVGAGISLTDLVKVVVRESGMNRQAAYRLIKRVGIDGMIKLTDDGAKRWVEVVGHE